MIQLELHRGVGYLVAVAVLTLLPVALSAQQAASVIAGQVSDTTGAVLPGVTVEAASPALIEGSRIAVTDGQGQYSVINLPPGMYSVAFTLPGFGTLIRDSIELRSGFTASIDASLTLGAIEESITVTGESPVVDVQRTAVQHVLSEEVLESIPSARGFASFVSLTPGIRADPRAQDVGGSQNDNAQAGTIWGSRAREFRVLLHGMPTYGHGQSRGIMFNTATAEEFNVALGGSSAETEAAGITINFIPKDGGNIFSGNFLINGTGTSLQSDNLNAELMSRGLTKIGKIDKIWDYNATLGGPVVQDKLWFFVGARWWGADKFLSGNYFNKVQGSLLYEPDLTRPAVRDSRNRDFTGRITWQASPRNKIAVQHIDEMPQFLYAIEFVPVAPEAASRYEFNPDNVTQVTWTSALSNKLLIEAGGQYFTYHFKTYHSEGVTSTDIQVTERTTGYRYGASSRYSNSPVNLTASRGSVSYVTGSHNFKTGFQTQQAQSQNCTRTQGDVTYSFYNQEPISLTQYATPYCSESRLKLNLAMYAQDQWTLDRLTINVGIRYDSLEGYVPPQSLLQTQFLGPASFPETTSVPLWKDINPRLGAAYDLFGDGRTAIKGSLGRYVVTETNAIAGAHRPINLLVNNVRRTWDDANGNLVPDCDLASGVANGECGSYQNSNFGTQRVGTAYSKDFLEGFGTRVYNWLMMAELQHEVRRNVSLHLGYIQRWYGNHPVTLNRALSSGDFTPYSVTAPVDSRLPGGGGYVIPGLYDVVPAKYGLVDNLVDRASNYGDWIEKSTFISFSLNSRFDNGATLAGSFDIGRSETDKCDIVMTNPQIRNTFVANVFGTGSRSNGQASGNEAPRTQDYCNVVVPWVQQAIVKMLFSYPLPADFNVSGNLQNLPGLPIVAARTFRNHEIAPSLGRNMARGSGGSARVDLVPPQTLFEPRISQFDVRFSRVFNIGNTRLEGMFDIYNAFNASPVLSENFTYGGSWLKPIQVMEGRILKFGAQVSF